MAIQWGPSSNGCRLGLEWAPLGQAAANMQVTCYVWFESIYGITDDTNTYSWSGYTSGSGANWSYRQGTKMMGQVTGWVTTSLSGPTNISLTFNAGGLEYPGNLSVTIQGQVPQRPMVTPNAPTNVTAGRVNDNRHDLTWTNNANGADGPVQNVKIWRQDDNNGIWAEVAWLPGNATSWSDTGTVAGRTHKWAVAGFNAAGGGPFTESNFWWNTPVTVSGLTAEKQPDGNIKLRWTNNTYGWGNIYIDDSPDGVNWTPNINNGGLPSTGAYTGPTEWTHVNPSTSATHRYRVIVEAAGLWSTFSATSNTVQLLAAPNAPTLLAPVGAPVNRSAPVTLTWRHNATDTTAQTGANLQYREQGTTAWTTLTATTAQSCTIAAGTLATGKTWEWQVQTRGAHASYSAWSAVSTFQSTMPPVASVTAPAQNAVVSSDSVAVSWSYSDPDNDVQTGAVVTLYNAAGTTVVTRDTLTGVALSRTIIGLANNTSYRLGVKVLGGGLDSVEVLRDISVSYVPPAAPVVTQSIGESTGVYGVTTSHPVEGGAPDYVWSAASYTALNGTTDGAGGLTEDATAGAAALFGPWTTLLVGAASLYARVDVSNPTNTNDPTVVCGCVLQAEVRNASNVVLGTYSAPTVLVAKDGTVKTAKLDLATLPAGAANFRLVARMTGPAGTGTAPTGTVFRVANGVVGGPLPTPVSNELWQDGVKLATFSAPGSCSVPLHDFARPTYTLKTIAANGATRTTVLTPPRPSKVGIHLNVGGAHAWMPGGGPSVATSWARDVIVHKFAGQTLPTTIQGPQSGRVLQVSGLVFWVDPESALSNWQAIATSGGVATVRTAEAKVSGAITAFDLKQSSTGWGTVSLTLTEAG